MSLNLPNSLAIESKESFMQVFANLYEHSPWVAERAYLPTKLKREYNDLQNFHSLLSEVLLDSDTDLQQELILAHPMLKAKRAENTELSKFSTIEQESAGLDNCSDKEIAMFEVLNEKYFLKFKFPFIMAIKEKNKNDIMSGFALRQQNSIELEKQNAIAEINKIAWLRIKEIYGI